jgi:hypothetical protein
MWKVGFFFNLPNVNSVNNLTWFYPEVKEDMLTKETDQLIQEEGNSLVSMYHWLVFECYVSCDVDYMHPHTSL